MSTIPTIDRLLNQTADDPNSVLQQLQQHPQLASQQDAYGYSLVHAAASYGHDELLRALIEQFHVDINIKDMDGETALFNIETVKMAQELIDLGIDTDATNNEGQTAAEKFDDEDEIPSVTGYLLELAHTSELGINGKRLNGVEEVHGLPPAPNGMDVSIGTMQAEDDGDTPDPEIRRRIEELADRPDFHEEGGQRELRELISQVVSGISTDERGSTSRRRLD